MQIGFFAEGEGPHLDIAANLILSVFKVMPDVPVYQLTDERTPELPGAKAIRLAGKIPMGVRRMLHCAAYSGDWIYCDTDILFRKDVRHVFEKPFDIALASREGTKWAGTRYAEIMPFNTGVIFSRNPKFFEMLLPNLSKLDLEFQNWGGEQYMVNELARQPDSPFTVEILPSLYNFTPAERYDHVEDVHILHLKGSRKEWIADYA